MGISMLQKRFLTALLLVLGAQATHAEDDWRLEQMVKETPDGLVFHAKPIAKRFQNQISAEEERAFQQRARHVISLQAKQKVAAGNTYFENEKRTYGWLMAQVLAGRQAAIADLQLEDAQAKEWHRETEGIDFYACFTLKHQARKFFYFGDLLEPEYRQRMLAGARAWTAEDPLRRSHYAFQGSGEGWGPDKKNSWVDVRTTENLYLMRLTSVYLFAEAAGSDEVAEKYKDEILRYTAALYRVGIGEWDSENYHGHSIAPLCNLYDFAADEEVKLCAKACLDWFFTAGALKYYRGGFNGPTKRDYNHSQPFGGSAANMLWLAFGDTPQPKMGDWESDEVHLITSAYRPPAAVYALARKDFPRPQKVFSSKPHYSATTTADLKSPPEYFETQYFGHSFQMGSLASGTSEDGGDVNGFKILAYSDARGANEVQVVPGPDPTFPGSPKYARGKVSGPNRVAQYDNLAIWLVKNGKSPWLWVFPREMRVSRVDNVTFLEGDRTWIAIRGLGTSDFAISDSLTEQLASSEKAVFAEHQVLSAQGLGGDFCGVAIEVGEKETHGTFTEFQRKAKAAALDVTKLAEGVVQYRAADGKALGFHWKDDSRGLGVWRNGERHGWKAHAAHLYRSDRESQPAGPVYAPWGKGVLYVEAGGRAFANFVTPSGAVSSSDGEPAEVRAWMRTLPSIAD